MAKTTITIRVDENLKAKAELACEYFGFTLTDVLIKQLRRTIDEHYKHRASEADAHVRHCQGRIAQASLSILQQLVEIRQGKGEKLELSPEAEKLLFIWGEE
jgi:hypothetical protein